LLSSKISFIQKVSKIFWQEKNPAPASGGRASARSADKENIISSKNNQFVANNLAARIKSYQTFTIILPNLIHKSKKRNLKR
jgi:hypothetical protein